MTEFELFKALRPFYPAREYALLPQVANGTGFAVSRHCDALALALWPSRGMRVSGFEIKSHRGDWLREKANPAKAEEIATYCNFWWIVTSGPHVVKADELPEGWGLKVWDESAGALKVEKKAPVREAQPLGMDMIAAILRKAQEVVTPDAVIEEARRDGFDKGKAESALRAANDSQELIKLRSRLRIIEQQTGLRIDSWAPPENIGDAINQALNGTAQDQVEKLRRIARAIAAEFGHTDPTDADIEASTRHSLVLAKAKARRR